MEHLNIRRSFIVITQWGIFPLIMVLTTWLMIESFQGLIDPLKASMIAFFGTIAAVAIIERLLPQNSLWNKRGAGDIKVDSTSFVVMMAAMDPLIKAVSPLLITILLVTFGLTENSGIFPNDWPFLAQLLLVAVLAEFGQYWMHRLSHENKWLWRVHIAHHSTKRIYWLNGFRVHPLNIIWFHLSGVFILFLVGANTEVMLTFATLMGVSNTFQHANIKLKHGVLNYVFSTNELHRWHHSTKLKEANNNYGAMLIIWDLVFGTYYKETDRSPNKLGVIGNESYPTDSYWKQILIPFFWKKWRSKKN